MEMSMLWGIRTSNVGSGDGKPERTTQGIVSFIKENASANVVDYRTNATYADTTWLNGGETWLDTYLEQLFRYGSGEKLVLAGSGAILGINQLIKNNNNIQMAMTPKTMAYGINVWEWVTPFGTIFMKTHPLFSYDSTTRNMMVLLEPKDLKFKYITDTTFYGEKGKTTGEGNNSNRIDGTKEEFLTEGGLEMHWPIKCGIANGVGLDNTLAS
jgi:hypothetical protein